MVCFKQLPAEYPGSVLSWQLQTDKFTTFTQQNIKMKNSGTISSNRSAAQIYKYDLFQQTALRKKSGVCSLDGEWDFFYSPQKVTARIEDLPAVEEFTGKMVTPGYWDDWYGLFDEEDFFGNTARFNPDYRKAHFPMANSLTPHASSNFLIGTGYYRKMLDLQLDDDAVVSLTVGPAMWECWIFCNRQLVGRSVGYSTESVFDLSKFVNRDQPNELIIAVCNDHDDGGAYCRKDNSHDGEARRARPGQHRGLAAQGYQSERAGIGGGVYLQINKSSVIRDCFVYAEQNQLRGEVQLHNADGKNLQLQWQLKYRENVLLSGKCACPGNQVCWEVQLPENTPLWSDTHPELLQIELQLMQADQVLDEYLANVGLRTFTRCGTGLQLNGRSIYLRGVTEHCYFPESCNPHFSFDKYMHDLGVLKQAGFNHIRCHTWCPPEPFYDACDALGFLVQTELPVVWSDAEAEAILRQIRRHPSAVILCEGNEKIMDDTMLEYLRKLAAMMHKLAPGMLFNPQEAMRGIEYDFQPGQQVQLEPVPHVPERLALTREFSDVYGALCNSMFSYDHDEFPGTAEAEKIMSIYQLPCLAHEAGILGGYLNFDLEKRYTDTYIGTDLFAAARENMQKHGVWEHAVEYYQYNSLFVASLRKQLFENLRSCASIAGYDYLGGIDTHWHLTGYPCGVFNEFYEEKYGESINDILQYNNDCVLLWSAGKYRSFIAGSSIKHQLQLSNYAGSDLDNVQLNWQLENSLQQLVEHGSWRIPQLPAGQINDLGELQIKLPDSAEACQLTLKVLLTASNGKVVRNQWKLWVYPPAGDALCTPHCREVDRLTDEDITFMEQGGAVLLSDNFPSAVEKEMFRTHTSGRSLLHAGAIIRKHPVWQKFPTGGFADWQFFRMMDASCSMVHDNAMPEFQPMLELIPSFKRIRRKSMLAEYKVGKGRLLCCSLHLRADDPAGSWLKRLLLDYLAAKDWTDAPEWQSEHLRNRLHNPVQYACQYRKIDAGGRPIDD